MNPRQRRGVLIMALAVVGAVGVFVLVASYVGEVRSQLGPMVTVLSVDSSVSAHQPIGEDALSETELPRRWVPETAVRDRVELAGKVAAAELPAGSVLQQGMLTDQPQLESGQREIAILVDAETGVAGKVQRGELVDIYATFGAEQGGTPSSRIVVGGALVIEAGDPQQVTERDEQGLAQNQVVPVTFALSVQESLELAYAESFAETVRLARRAPGESPGGLHDGQRIFRLSPGQGS